MLNGGADSYSLLLVLRSCSVETSWPCVRADLLDLVRARRSPLDVFGYALSRLGPCVRAARRRLRCPGAEWSRELKGGTQEGMNILVA